MAVCIYLVDPKHCSAATQGSTPCACRTRFPAVRGSRPLALRCTQPVTTLLAARAQRQLRLTARAMATAQVRGARCLTLTPDWISMDTHCLYALASECRAGRAPSASPLVT